MGQIESGEETSSSSFGERREDGPGDDYQAQTKMRPLSVKEGQRGKFSIVLGDWEEGQSLNPPVREEGGERHATDIHHKKGKEKAFSWRKKRHRKAKKEWGPVKNNTERSGFTEKRKKGKKIGREGSNEVVSSSQWSGGGGGKKINEFWWAHEFAARPSNVEIIRGGVQEILSKEKTCFSFCQSVERLNKKTEGEREKKTKLRT